jgi:endoglucanase
VALLLAAAMTVATIAAAGVVQATEDRAEAAVPANDWLHVQGNQIVDEAGNPVWLTGTNWFGFNASERVFHGLWSGNITEITKSMADRGINIVRVPISTQLLLEWKAGTFGTVNVNTFANPELLGLNSLQVFDYFLGLCQQFGIKVMIDVHSAEADNSGHIHPVWWKGSITTELFYQGWEWITTRYRSNDTVVAMDIKNEPHGTPNQPPRAKWDNTADQDNFKTVCETAGRRILAINPNVLILCEGIEVYPREGETWSSPNTDPDLTPNYYYNWWGGNLRGARQFPINLGANQDQLVYSPHDYGPLVFDQPWFQKPFDKASLTTDVWGPNWLYLHTEGTAPLLIGEWGGRLGQDARQDKWMFALRDLIAEHRLHQTFWVLNPNSGDTGGLLLDDWKTWDETKYAMLKPALWQHQGKFVSLDHQVKLGGSASTTGISLGERYGDGGDTTPPTAPGGLTVTGSTNTTVSLSWNAATDNVGVTGYDVYRGSTKVNATPLTTRTYTDTGLTAGTTYTYTVRARDAAGNQSPASAGVPGTTTGGGTNTPPSVPTGLTVGTTTSTSVALSWTASTDNVSVAGYRVFRNGTLVASVPGTSYTDTGLTAATAYTYRVLAYDGPGLESAQSAAVTGTTQPGGGGGSVRVEYRNTDSSATDNQIRPQLRIANPGTSTLALTGVAARYYFTRDGSQSITVTCDWAQVGCTNISTRVVVLSTPVTGADAYMEVTFTGGSVAAGQNSGDIQLRLNKSDWSNFNEANDYSRGTNTAYAAATQIPGYIGGTLSWGTPPA